MLMRLLDRGASLLQGRWALPLFALLCIAMYTWRLDVSPDSFHYADIARTIATEGRVATYHLQVSSQRVPDTDLLWPPGYPALMAPWLRLGLSRGLAASLVAILSYMAVILLVVVSALRREWALLGVLAWLLLIWGTGTAFFALSEAPFFALIAAAALCFGFALGRRWDRLLGMAALAGALGGAASLTRYAGVSVIPAFFVAGVLLAVGYRRDRALATKALTGGAVAALVAAGLVLLWVWRNNTLNGCPLGPTRPPSEVSLRGVLWLLTINIGTGLTIALPFLLGLAIARRNDDAEVVAQENPTRTACLWSSTAVAGVWVVIYLALMAWQESKYKIDPLTNRYMFPAYGAALLMGVMALEARCHLDAGQFRRLAMVFCLLTPLLLLPGVTRVLRHTGVHPRTPVYDWITRSTPEGALLIGNEIWEYRDATQRPVLESGSYMEGQAALDGVQVLGFLRRHAGRFPAMYLLATGPEYPKAVKSYEAAGIKLKLVYGGKDPDRTPAAAGVRLLQVLSWPQGSPQP